MRLRRPHALGLFVGVVNAVGIGLLAALLASMDLSDLRDSAALYLLLLAILMFGERRPIEVARGDTENEQVSIASTFGMALVMLAPLGIAVGAQAIAVLSDELRRRKPG